MLVLTRIAKEFVSVNSRRIILERFNVLEIFNVFLYCVMCINIVSFLFIIMAL